MDYGYGGLGQPYVDAIKRAEGFTPRAAWDYRQNTNGYGTRARYPGEVIDQKEADGRFDAEIGNASNLVRSFAPNLDPGTHAALTSLTFNAGADWMKSGLGQAIKAGNMDAARASFLAYNRAGGQVLPGLANRRSSEVAWFGGGQPPADTTRPPGMMALGGPRNGPAPMATDYTGQYVPDEIIRQNQRQASNYWATNPSGGKFSLAEGLMAGLGSTIGNTQAANAIMNNQRVRQSVLADGTPTLATLLKSGVPEYQDMAAKMMLQQASPQAQIELERAKIGLENERQAQPVRMEQMRTDLALKKQTLDQGKNTFHQVGVDALGNPQYGFVDPVNKTVVPAGGGGIGGAGNTGKLAAISHLSGDEWANAAVETGALPKHIVEEIKAYHSGKLPYNASMAQKPRGQALTSLIMQYDPSFDAVNYTSRNATRKDFTSGTSAKNITSFNTAIGHLGHLNDAIDGLGNTGYPLVNSAVNAVKRNVDPDFAARESRFNTARTAVTEELARAFKGMGATVTEVHEWEKKLSAADSPQALRAAIQEGVGLLQSRIDALGQQYNKGMGTSRDPLELLSPEARSTLSKITAGSSGHSTAKEEASPAPVKVRSPAEARSLPKGTRIILPDGSEGVVP